MLQVCQAVLLVLLLCNAVASDRVPEPESIVRIGVESGIQDLPVEEYVAVVLATESGSFRSEEALKAMAVAIRTYAAHHRGRHKAEGFDYCGTQHCQHIRSKPVAAKIRQAVLATSGETLWHGQKPAAAFYHANCGGDVESSSEVWPGATQAYLQHKHDAHCTRDGKKEWSSDITKPALQKVLAESGLEVPDPLERVTISKRTSSGRIASILLSGASELTISGATLRLLVGRAMGWRAMPAAPRDLRDAGGYVVFTGSGAGHAVGLCQAGAESMGRHGRSHREILEFYYPGTKLVKSRW